MDYTLRWCEANNWEGHPNKGPKNEWTWNYGEEKSSSVLFADWHTCYQVYLDLYQMEQPKDPKKVKDVFDVINYQINTLEDSYWWWVDGLFMGMPVFTKLYNLTKEEKYLNKLYEFFTYSMELMYDGKGGIPTSEEGYKSTALFGGPYGGKKAVNSNFSNPENYKNLFYRDANYVYPANPLPEKLSNIKNFWSRGNGWAFASLIRVLRDLPEDWKFRPLFERIYKDMARAIILCQKLDEEENGFWTQSMLAHEFSCAEYNSQGYETSGTAFFTFGLLAGINDGLLKKEEFISSALKGWNYLTKIATHENGKVGYVQWVGGEAGRAATYENTQDFAVGACLLAATEKFTFDNLR